MALMIPLKKLMISFLRYFGLRDNLHDLEWLRLREYTKVILLLYSMANRVLMIKSLLRFSLMEAVNLQPLSLMLGLVMITFLWFSSLLRLVCNQYSSIILCQCFSLLKVMLSSYFLVTFNLDIIFYFLFIFCLSIC